MPAQPLSPTMDSRRSVRPLAAMPNSRADRSFTRRNLRYAPRRVRCLRCGVTTELVPWAAHEPTLLRCL